MPTSRSIHRRPSRRSERCLPEIFAVAPAITSSSRPSPLRPGPSAGRCLRASPVESLIDVLVLDARTQTMLSLKAAMTIYAEPRLLPCGDRALSVELGDEISRDVNAQVLALDYLIRQQGLPGITETVPSFRSLLVYYDPSVVAYEHLGAVLRELASRARPEVLPAARVVELPCCYDGQLGFELEAAAAKLRLSAEEVVTLHAGAEYYVDFVGFTP